MEHFSLTIKNKMAHLDIGVLSDKNCPPPHLRDLYIIKNIVGPRQMEQIRQLKMEEGPVRIVWEQSQ